MKIILSYYFSMLQSVKSNENSCTVSSIPLQLLLPKSPFFTINKYLGKLMSCSFLVEFDWKNVWNLPTLQNQFYKSFVWGNKLWSTYTIIVNLNVVNIRIQTYIQEGNDGMYVWWRLWAYYETVQRNFCGFQELSI